MTTTMTFQSTIFAMNGISTVIWYIYLTMWLEKSYH